MCASTSDGEPGVASAREIVERQAGYIIAASEEMPDGKYDYHPTPEQWTHGR